MSVVPSVVESNNDSCQKSLNPMMVASNLNVAVMNAVIIIISAPIFGFTHINNKKDPIATGKQNAYPVNKTMIFAQVSLSVSSSKLNEKFNPSMINIHIDITVPPC